MMCNITLRNAIEIIDLNHIKDILAQHENKRPAIDINGIKGFSWSNNVSFFIEKKNCIISTKVTVLSKQIFLPIFEIKIIILVCFLLNTD